MLLIGLLNMTMFDADILHYYAFYFLFGVMQRPLANCALMAVFIGLNLANCVMILTPDFDAGWNWDANGVRPKSAFQRRATGHPLARLSTFLRHPKPLVAVSRTTQITLVIGGTATFAIAETLSTALMRTFAQLYPELVALVTTEPVLSMPLYTLARLGVACAVFGACLLVSDWPDRAGTLGVVVPAGHQTQTLYIAPILVGMGTLKSLGMLVGQTFHGAVTASLLFCLEATIYACLCSRWGKREPIKALMCKVAG